LNNFARSFVCHVVIVALVLFLGATAHKIVPASYHERVIFMPASVPVPVDRPVRAVAPASVVPLRLTSAAEQQPIPITAEMPSSPLELPAAPVVQVTKAPQAIVGTFSSPEAGSPSGHQGGTVMSAGFGSEYEGAGNGHGVARVVVAGFSVTPAPEPRAVTTRVAQPPTQPVILSEPAAVYSDAARRARIQGTVDIRVKFRVDGTVEVLEIVNGLPGLNESALAVAKGIKFVPAASDFTTLIHVRFELL
jgi:TonB family protein